jgi:lysozyme
VLASEDLLNFLKDQEDLRLKAYKDPGGVWTIGYGHTADVKPGQTCTVGQAELWLDSDVFAVECALEKLLPREVDQRLTQGQQNALISLSFNAGSDIPSYAPKLWAALLSGDDEACAHEFLDIDKQEIDGKMVTLPGLKTRREKEAAMFLEKRGWNS